MPAVTQTATTEPQATVPAPSSRRLDADVAEDSKIPEEVQTAATELQALRRRGSATSQQSAAAAAVRKSGRARRPSLNALEAMQSTEATTGRTQSRGRTPV